MFEICAEEEAGWMVIFCIYLSFYWYWLLNKRQAQTKSNVELLSAHPSPPRNIIWSSKHVFIDFDFMNPARVLRSAEAKSKMISVNTPCILKGDNDIKGILLK